MSENIIYKIVDKKTSEEIPPLDDMYYEPDTTTSLIREQIKQYILKRYRENIDPERIKLRSKNYKSNAQDIPDIEVSTIFKDPTSKDNVITFQVNQSEDEYNIPNIAEMRTSRKETFIDGLGNRFTYSGEKDEDDKPYGNGIIKYISGDNTGDEYVGMINENYLPNGAGTMTIQNPLNPIFKYSGTFSNGNVQSNSVKIIYKPNNKNNYREYTGDIKKHFTIMPHGRGKMILNNLDEFIGEFALGLYEFGTMCYKNGNIKVYSGSWQRNKPNAYGTTAGNGIVIDNKNNRYEGDVVDGVYEGYGTMNYNDGTNRDFYDGMWSKGEPSYGEMTYKDGRPSYEGVWENGEPLKAAPVTNVVYSPVIGSPPRRNTAARSSSEVNSGLFVQPLQMSTPPRNTTYSSSSPSSSSSSENNPPPISRKKNKTNDKKGGSVLTKKYSKRLKGKTTRNAKKRPTIVRNNKSKKLKNGKITKSRKYK